MSFLAILAALITMVYSLLLITRLMRIHESLKEVTKERRPHHFAKKRDAYQQALVDLRNDPTNHALHEQALTFGREYSSAKRYDTGITLFDEIAIANDIRAVTANASHTYPSAGTPHVASVEERLLALKKLQENNLISDDEYEQKRKSVLDNI
jgi:hypothetical protein